MMAIIEIYLSTKTDCVLSEKSFDLVDKFRIILLQFFEEQLVVDFKNRTLVKVGTMCIITTQGFNHAIDVRQQSCETTARKPCCLLQCNSFIGEQLVK